MFFVWKGRSADMIYWAFTLVLWGIMGWLDHEMDYPVTILLCRA